MLCYNIHAVCVLYLSARAKHDARCFSIATHDARCYSMGFYSTGKVKGQTIISKSTLSLGAKPVRVACHAVCDLACIARAQFRGRRTLLV